MALTAKGLIVREFHIGEADRFVTVLTDTLGVIRASVRGARRVNSRSGASTRLLSYASLSLVKGREKYIVDTAVPERVFFASGGEVEQIALAQYFCELFAAVSPQEDAAPAYLQLLLNSLHLLEKGEDRDRIKAVAELRLLSMAGYTPVLSDCRCGKHRAPFAFDPVGGMLSCSQCAGGGIPLSPSVLQAMRHIVQADAARIFSFRLPPNDILQLADVSERFVHCQLSRSFKTLEFYHSLSHIGEML
ncbi:MAG: DNA repair protein RecO [Ruminococcaceae bacterium]|nr:DNA repair protein RecO [Oscillospiraceae bacterium]